MKKNTDSQVDNKTGNTKKNSSALAAAAKAGSAVDHAKAKSSRDVNGASGIRNTGTNVSYEDKETR